MTVTAVVRLGEMNQTTGLLAAFAHEETRGMTDTPSIVRFGPYTGRAVYHLTVHANMDSEAIDFRFYDGVSTTTPQVKG